MLATALPAAVAARGVSHWDVVVAGAGPAGSIAARALASAGAQVLLVDRQAFPRWKVCGSCLNRGALATLAAAGLGDLVSERGGVPLRRLRLLHAKREAVVPLRGSWVLAREVLDHALVDAALEVGATFRGGARADWGEVADGGRSVRCIGAGGVEVVRGTVVIDATGLGGTHADGDVEVAASSRIGLGAIVADSGYGLEAGELHMVIGRAGYVGMVRLADGTLDVGAAVDASVVRALGPEASVSALLDETGRPQLGGRPVRGWRGTPALTRRHRRPAEARLLRVGDAAGYVEPFTGEGIGWALADGLEAARLALRGVRLWDRSLERAWAGHHRAARRGPSARLAWALRRPRLTGAAMAALGRAPILAEPVLRRVAKIPPAALGGLRAGLHS